MTERKETGKVVRLWEGTIAADLQDAIASLPADLGELFSAFAENMGKLAGENWLLETVLNLGLLSIAERLLELALENERNPN